MQQVTDQSNDQETTICLQICNSSFRLLHLFLMHVRVFCVKLMVTYLKCTRVAGRCYNHDTRYYVVYYYLCLL